MKINPAEYKILVVDDVQSNVLLLKALLGREGFGIVIAMNGTEALQKVKSEHPDLILLDVMMPDMDGFEVAGHLKLEPEQAEIPIIFLTALNDSASVVKGFQLGANDFISKPFRREELLIRVEHQLSLVDARRIILRQTEELRKTIAGRDKLYSVIAHDLRSPMASIKMLCNTIMMSIDRQTVPADVFEMLEMTNKTAEEVDSILKKILKKKSYVLGQWNGEEVYKNGNGLFIGRKFIRYYFEENNLIVEGWTTFIGMYWTSQKEFPVDDKYFLKVTKTQIADLIDQIRLEISK